LFFGGESLSQEYRYIGTYRNTLKFGAITLEIAVCNTCKAVIPPSSRYFSKTGAHGEFYYVHEHPLDVILLHRSNSGRKGCGTSSGLSHLHEAIRKVWIFEGHSPVHVLKLLVENGYRYDGPVDTVVPRTLWPPGPWMGYETLPELLEKIEENKAEKR